MKVSARILLSFFSAYAFCLDLIALGIFLLVLMLINEADYG